MTWPDFLVAHRSTLVIYMRSRVPSRDHEDVAHVVIERALHQTPRTPHLGVYRSMMWLIARRAVADYYRHGRHVPDGLDEWIVAPDPFTAAETLDELRQAVSSIERHRHRTALMLHALGYSTSEIADHLHTTHINVYQMIHRARHEVRGATDPVGRALQEAA